MCVCERERERERQRERGRDTERQRQRERLCDVNIYIIAWKFFMRSVSYHSFILDEDNFC